MLPGAFPGSPDDDEGIDALARAPLAALGLLAGTAAVGVVALLAALPRPGRARGGGLG